MIVITDNGETHITVETNLRGQPIGGFDTTIVVMPTEFYVTIGGGERMLAIRPFTDFLRRLGEKQAGGLGEALHHAEYTITTSPTTVEALGSLHDCDECRAGVRHGKRWLTENPGLELIVGQLFWAGP